MTNREFYNAIAMNETLSDEIRAFATEAIGKLDHTNELRKAASAKKSAEKQAEKEPVRAALIAVIDNEPKTATMLIEAAGLDIKPASVPSLLRPFVDEGSVLKVDVKVPGKGKQRGYVKA
jgi:hypothetical protein